MTIKPKINIIHNVNNLKCAIIGCDRPAITAFATGWAADTQPALQLTAICTQHMAELCTNVEAD